MYSVDNATITIMLPAMPAGRHKLVGNAVLKIIVKLLKQQ